MSNTRNLEQIEEILEGVANEYSAGANYENAKPLIVEEAEQAITSLIKELVAGAKPKNNWLEGSDLFYGQDAGVGEFEQNLLKALEEV